MLCVYNKRHVLILPSSEHPMANWGRSGDLTEGVTSLDSIPDIYRSEDCFKGKQDNENFLKKYGNVADYGFYKASKIISPSGTRIGRIPSIGELQVMFDSVDSYISVINDHLSRFPVYTEITTGPYGGDILLSSAQYTSDYYWGRSLTETKFRSLHKAMSQGIVIPVADVIQNEL